MAKKTINFQKDVMEPIGQLKEDIGDYTGNETITNFIEKRYIKTDGETVDINNLVIGGGFFDCVVVDCKKGDEFVITGKGGGSPRLWAFIGTEVDGVRPVISNSTSTITEKEALIMAPDNSEKLVVNVDNRNEYKLIKGSKIRHEISTIKKEIFTSNEKIEVTIENGKYCSLKGNSPNSDISCISNYIPVKFNRTYNLKKLHLVGNRAVCGFDLNENFVKCYKTNTEETELTITIDENTRYLRCTGNVDIPMEVELLPMRVNEMRDFIDISCIKKPISPYRKILTLVDDDTTSEVGMAELQTVCNELGVKCTFGAITKLFANNPTRVPFLKGLQADGFHICSHTHSHTNWYDKGIDGSAMFTMEEVEKDLIKSLEILKNNGFLDSNMLIYPGSSCTRKGIDKIAKKWTQCACTIFDGNNIYGYTTEHMIARNKVSKGNFGTDVQWYTDRLRNLEKDGINWVVYYTHTGSTVDWDKDLMKSVLQSAIDDGWTIMPLNEAWKYRKPMFDMQNMFGY